MQAPLAAQTSSWEAVRSSVTRQCKLPWLLRLRLGVTPAWSNCRADRLRRATAVREASWGNAGVEQLPYAKRLVQEIHSAVLGSRLRRARTRDLAASVESEVRA